MKYKRIIVTHYGGPEELRVVEEECSEPKRGEVRVRILTAGVSLPDVMMREGIHPETPKLPFTPGWDFVGVVDRLGPGVSGIELGHVNSSDKEDTIVSPYSALHFLASLHFLFQFAHTLSSAPLVKVKAAFVLLL